MTKKKFLKYALYLIAFVLLIAFAVLCGRLLRFAVLDYQEAHNEPDNRSYCLYYNSLDYRSQLLYNAVIDSARNLEEHTDIIQYSYTMDEFQNILKAVRADNPDLFYLDYNALVLNHAKHKSRIDLVYLADADKIDEMVTEYNQTADSIISSLNSKMTEFEKETAINDWITDNCIYAVSSEDKLANTSYGVLVEKSSFCDGYAYAAKELFNRAGIDSCIVYGKSLNSDHVWNIVTIDSKSYHLDVMWNDANILNDDSLRFHGYFNLSDEEIKKDHSFDYINGFLPSANTDNCYYKSIYAYAETKDELEDIIYNQLKKAVSQKRAYIEIKCQETKDNGDIAPYFERALSRINSELGSELLINAFQVYEASTVSNAITIQIFYK